MVTASGYHDARLGIDVETVMPGDHRVSRAVNRGLMTLLGSCVAACIRDPSERIGGLNHFLLPDGEGDPNSARYGVHAMELLINSILRTGGSRRRLEAKVFGGGNVMHTGARETVGDRNAQFVKRFLANEGIPVAAEDLGGVCARRIIFIPGTGKVHVQQFDGAAARGAEAADRNLRKTLASTKESGGVELF